jgi:hypothetical protein
MPIIRTSKESTPKEWVGWRLKAWRTHKRQIYSAQDKSSDQLGTEIEGDTIIRVTIARGATIKDSIFETRWCTQRMKDFSLVKSCLEDLKIWTLTER